MKYFIIAGEASGDLHGSNLIKALKKKDAHAEFNFWGGDLMAAQAEGLKMHYKSFTLMGFIEVVLNLRFILSTIKLCKTQILSYKPDVVIFIDYPGFNLRMAAFCKKHGFKTVYYIAPKIWAWKESRGKKLEKFIDELLIIFPFEIDYFKKWNVKTTYVGNPLQDALKNYKEEQLNHDGLPANKPIIALLPGSRKQEIERILPVMSTLVSHFNQYQFVICGAPSIGVEAYQPFINENTTLIMNRTYDVLHRSTAAIVCSGTATLETALFNVPQVCGYVANPISYWIARMLVKIKYISLVNLCLNKTAITELIQHEFNINQLIDELNAILPGGSKREVIMDDYKQLHVLLGVDGASERAATLITG